VFDRLAIEFAVVADAAHGNRHPAATDTLGTGRARRNHTRHRLGARAADAGARD